MKQRWFVSVVGLCLGLGASNCGGSKPAESASDAKADEAKAVESSGGEEPTKADAPSKPEASGSASAKPSPVKDDSPKSTRTAEDIITAPDVVFLFSFNDSEPKQVAEEKCTKKAADNPKKMNQCMAAARDAFPADGHRFKKDDKDQWWWITLRQTGNRLTALHKIPVEFAEQTDTTVTLKPVGKDKGSAPMKPPAKVVFEVPNDYQIALKDAKHGRLVFQAKVGAVTE